MALDDKTRKLIVADRASGMSIRAIAKKYSVSTTTVQRTSQRDPELTQMVTQKQEENTQSVLEYMDSQSARKKSLLDKLLMAMEDKTDNLDMFTNIKDLATAYGILTDKEIKLAELGIMGVHRKKDSEIDPLSASLMEMAGELDGD